MVNARSQGYQDVLKDCPDVRIAAELNADWSETRAEKIVTNWLTAGKDLDAIVAQNDEMAIGAARALQIAGLTGQIAVFGVDASAQAIHAIANGTMRATISQQTEQQGFQAVEACVGLARGQTVSSEILVPQIILTADSFGQNNMREE